MCLVCANRLALNRTWTQMKACSAHVFYVSSPLEHAECRQSARKGGERGTVQLAPACCCYPLASRKQQLRIRPQHKGKCSSCLARFKSDLVQQHQQQQQQQPSSSNTTATVATIFETGNNLIPCTGKNLLASGELHLYVWQCRVQSGCPGRVGVAMAPAIIQCVGNSALRVLNYLHTHGHAHFQGWGGMPLGQD